ncbi:chromatin DNA-binding EKC/KEOPS complex subunit [Martiniozyma asiatica (nom. inval.)]|nr:chromatin DNA-binding EKC/KEOPS complex subunit [Martiniozyma asiatica]
MSEPTFNFHLTLTIPFESEEHAKIAQKTLSPDPVLKPQELRVTYATKTQNLIIKFDGISNRAIRVSANNTMENIKTIMECFENFA